MRRRFKCDPKWITVRYPAKCAEPNCQPQSTLATAPFITPAIEPSTAPIAVMGKRPNAILPRTGSTKTAIERNPRNKERRF